MRNEESALNRANLSDQPARRWVQVLARYREPRTGRSLFELGVTLVPFFLIWALAWWALSISMWLSLGLAVLNAGFLVRLFAIQHDCGHGAFFREPDAERLGWPGARRADADAL